MGSQSLRSQARILKKQFGLTARESAVALKLLEGDGYSKTVAHALGISPRTIEIHIVRMKKKLSAASKIDLVLKIDRVVRGACQS